MIITDERSLECVKYVLEVIRIKKKLERAYTTSSGEIGFLFEDDTMHEMAEGIAKMVLAADMAGLREFMEQRAFADKLPCDEACPGRLSYKGFDRKKRCAKYECATCGIKKEVC